ncbi:hypothetical protein ACFQPG_07340 [Sphingomonas sp. GCM10030256]|uniref:hypothetical protein n=1 Tax=Sphingomonas sp. GCM10030256 TaxID=3273427 RepID=UPI00361C013A
MVVEGFDPRFPVGPNEQTFEQEGTILVAVVDRTYGDCGDEKDWGEMRERFRQDLEAKFKMRFEDGDVGPGASLPAFLTLLEVGKEVPNWVWFAAAFFAGDPIQKNLEAWPKIAARLRPLLRIPAYLNRQGAAVVALQAITDELGREPKSWRLCSYRIITASDPEKLEDMPRSTTITDPADTLYLGFMSHVFEIEADGSLFRVGVDGNESKTLQLGQRA